ncbi:DUF6262 family protein [Streptomyces sp. NBC_00452]|uniref:DUF6262 family protein n=1 Tax=Streptomyces sp. NBC_00452 TaxID=2975746 RepID=UPI0022527D59|nr:DUF6262 family protein [Streptomyces sp. NBC_00452]MCX5061697.1 DUF6262 family protein [Streptomyces sp. NBC_00452]
MTLTAEDRTAAAVAARRRAADLMNERVRDALTQIRRERAKVTFAAVARRADVSRTFLYQNDTARKLVETAAADAAGKARADQTEQAAHLEATWRERALNAEETLKITQAEILAQRAQIAGLLGKVRDLESDLPSDAGQRLISENTTLKDQVRQLRQDHKSLEGRLKSARENNRFLDKRIADLETQLLEAQQIGKA